MANLLESLDSSGIVYEYSKPEASKILPPEQREKCFLTRTYCPVIRYAAIISADIRLHQGARKEGRKYVGNQICQLKDSEVDLSPTFPAVSFANVMGGGGNFPFADADSGRIAKGVSELEGELDQTVVLEEDASSLLSNEIQIQQMKRIVTLRD